MCGACRAAWARQAAPGPGEVSFPGKESRGGVYHHKGWGLRARGLMGIAAWQLQVVVPAASREVCDVENGGADTTHVLAHVPPLILWVVLESDVVGKGWHVFGH